MEENLFDEQNPFGFIMADALPLVPKNDGGGSASANDSACIFRQRKTLKPLIYKVSALVRMTGVEPT